jgi:hypothetical protein
MNGRRFPPPWIVEDIDAAFVVKDGGGQKVAYVCKRTKKCNETRPYIRARASFSPRWAGKAQRGLNNSPQTRQDQGRARGCAGSA